MCAILLGVQYVYIFFFMLVFIVLNNDTYDEQWSRVDLMLNDTLSCLASEHIYVLLSEVYWNTCIFNSFNNKSHGCVLQFIFLKIITGYLGRHEIGLQKSIHLSKICKSKMEKNRQGQCVAGMLNRWLLKAWRMTADGRGWQLWRGYRGQFQSRHIAERADAERMADVSCTPNVNTGDTYFNYKMHKITSFNVRATTDVLTFMYLIFPPSLGFQGQ